MIKNDYSIGGTYTVIISIKFANGVKENLCRYTCDINLNPINELMDKLNATFIDEDGTPTVEFVRWITDNYPEFKISDILDEDSRIFFEFVDSLPAVNI